MGFKFSYIPHWLVEYKKSLRSGQEKLSRPVKIFEGRRHSMLKKAVLGAHPLIQYYLDKLRIREIFSTYVKSDARQALLSEDGVCLFVHNILTDPLPLYEIGQWVSSRDLECLGVAPLT